MDCSVPIAATINAIVAAKRGSCQRVSGVFANAADIYRTSESPGGLKDGILYWCKRRLWLELQRCQAEWRIRSSLHSSSPRTTIKLPQSDFLRQKLPAH